MTSDELVDRVTFWQERLYNLGLSHWDIEVELVEQPDDREDAAAVMHTSPQYDEATMEVAHFALERDDLDTILVHELLHSAFRGVHCAEDDALFGLSHGERSAHSRRLEYERENLIQRLAVTIRDLCGTVD